jgi:hypothetical protein
MKPRTIVSQAWWLGFFSNGCLVLLIQDYYGLEAYTARMTKNWVDLPWVIWFIPLAIMGIWHWAVIGRIPRS